MKINQHPFLYSTIVAFLCTPVLVLAQSENISKFFEKILSILSLVFPVLVALATVGFLWGVVVYIRSAADEKARTEGRQRITWGLIALFMILSVWGLVGILLGTFLENGSPTTLPYVDKNGVKIPVE